MKLPLVDELSNEINRLLIAGSRFAKDDPRLLQLVPKLEALSEKAPIFKRLSSELTALLQATEEVISHKLLALNNLLTAVNLTQLDSADTSIEKQSLTPVLNINDIHTQSTYKQISPLIHVLTNKGTAGRSSAIKEHFVYNQIEECDDWRVNYFMDQALSDKNHDFVKTLDNEILPKVSQTIVPFLYNSFLNQSAGQDLRLKHIFAKSPDLAKPIALEILKTENWGSDYKLKVAAIYILSQDPSQEALILSYLDDKKVEVREAVYEALAQINSASAAQILFSLLDKETKKHPDRLLANALQRMNLQPLQEKIVHLVAEKLEAFKAISFNTVEDQTVRHQKIAAIRELNLVLPLLCSLSDPSILGFYYNLLLVLGNPKYDFRNDPNLYLMEIQPDGMLEHIASFGVKGAELYELIFSDDLISPTFKAFLAKEAFSLIHKMRGKEIAFNLFAPYYLCIYEILERALSFADRIKNFPKLWFSPTNQLSWDSKSQQFVELDKRWFDLSINLFLSHFLNKPLDSALNYEFVLPLNQAPEHLLEKVNTRIFFQLPLDYPSYYDTLLTYFSPQQELKSLCLPYYDSSLLKRIIQLEAGLIKDKLMIGFLRQMQKVTAHIVLPTQVNEYALTTIIHESNLLQKLINKIMGKIREEPQEDTTNCISPTNDTEIIERAEIAITWWSYILMILNDPENESISLPAEMRDFLLSLPTILSLFFAEINVLLNGSDLDDSRKKLYQKMISLEEDITHHVNLLLSN